MKGLTFRARYVAPILAGSKTTTIRRPSNRLPGPLEPFRLVCRYDLPPFAFGTVLEVRDVLPVQLTNSDARADGFTDLAELLAALEVLTASGPDAQPSLLPHVWRIIRFRLDSIQ
jgi:hypothetical protein